MPIRKLNKKWNKNDSVELNNIYVDILKCLKYSNSREEALYEVMDLQLENPYEWIQWAEEQYEKERKNKLQSSKNTIASGL